jgi:hypothetical protein
VHRNDATLTIMNRRGWLKLGLFGGVLFAIGSGTFGLWREGWAERRLTPAGRDLFAAIARVVLEGILPDPAAGSEVHESALQAHLDRVETSIRGMPAAVQAEIGQLLALLLHPAGRYALTGLTSDWKRASTPELRISLQGLRESRLELRQQTYHALRDLTNAAYFADPSTWAFLGYPGPRPV